MAAARKLPADRAAHWFWFGRKPAAYREIAEDYLTKTYANCIAEMEPLDRLEVLVEEATTTRSDEWRDDLECMAVVGWPDEIGRVAGDLLRSRGWRRRIVGAELLESLCQYRPESCVECARIIAKAVDRETDPAVLSFLAVAMHRAADGEGSTSPKQEQGRDDEWDHDLHWPIGRTDSETPHEVWRILASDRVARILTVARDAEASNRRRLAISLSHFDISIADVRATLLGLTADPDDGVRDWATFEVAHLGTWLDPNDIEDVRAALWARVNETHGEIEDEALYGLAVRKAPGAFELLEERLRGRGVSPYLIDAAEELADPRLLPALRVLGEWWKPEWVGRLEAAIEACGGEIEREPEPKTERACGGKPETERETGPERETETERA